MICSRRHSLGGEEARKGPGHWAIKGRDPVFVIFVTLFVSFPLAFSQKHLLFSGTGRLAQAAKCVACKQEDVSSSPSTGVKARPGDACL